MTNINNKLGFCSAILTVIFLLAYILLNVLNPVASWSGIEAFAADFSVSQVLWLFPALGLAMTLIVLMAAIHRTIAEERKIFSLIGLAFIGVYVAIISVNYFLQLTVVTPNLLNGEVQGLSLLASANPHGVFFAFETLGYLVQEFAFLFVAFAFSGDKLQQFIRWTFLINFVAGLGSLVGMYLVDSMTLVAITVLVWAVTLIASSILLAKYFRRQKMA